MELQARFDGRGHKHVHHGDAGEKLMERLGETVGNLASRDDTAGQIFRGIASFLDDIGNTKKDEHKK
jgi:hypothetical protein